MNEETWKPITGFELAYHVSDQGRIKAINRLDFGGRKRKEKLLRPRIVGAGYLQVVLYESRVRYTKYVHVLVAREFVSNPRGFPEVNHKNTDKADCHYSNLEWTTHSGNIQHAIQAGCFDEAWANQLHGFKKPHSEKTNRKKLRDAIREANPHLKSIRRKVA